MPFPAASHPLRALPHSALCCGANPFPPRVLGFQDLLGLTKERQEMGDGEKGRSQQVAFLGDSSSSIIPGPTGQAHRGSSFCPLICDLELVDPWPPFVSAA